MLYNPPLSIAARNKHKELVSFLLQKGADPNGRDHLGTFDCTAIHHASQLGEVEIVKQLIEAKAESDTPNEWGDTAMHYASEHGQKECISTLLEKGSSPQTQNFRGMTPLHKAALNGRFPCLEPLVEYCIERKLSIDLRDNSGDTPMHSAVKNNQAGCAAYLIKSGAVVDTRDWNGNTALHSAAVCGNSHLIEFILEVCPNFPIAMLNKKGNTALHLAAHVGSAPCVEVLVKHGAPISPLNMKGRSPKDEAAHMGHAKVANLFRAVDTKLKSPLTSETLAGVMATNFSHTLTDFLSTNATVTADTPAFNMGLAQTLGHFHTILAPKAKPKKHKPKPSPNKKKPAPRTASAKTRTPSVNTNTNTTNTNQTEEKDTLDEELSDTTENNADYSISDLEEEEESDEVLFARLQLSDSVSVDNPKEPKTSKSFPIAVKQDESVDMIAEFVINKIVM